MEDRIVKLGIEINNLEDEEKIESKKKYREQLSQKLEEVRNEPDTDTKESEIEEHNNRSQAMMGNQNARKLIFDEIESLKKPQKFSGGAIRSDEEIVSILAHSNKGTDVYKLFEDAGIPSYDIQGKRDYIKNLLNEYKKEKISESGFKVYQPEETVITENETVETEEPKNDELNVPTPKIDSKVTERINDISMSGSAGNVYQHDVNVEMEEFKNKFNYDKMNPQQKEYFRERLSSYAGLVGSSYNEMASKRLAAGPSWVVAGPAKYNTKRFNQKMEAERRAYETFEEKKEKFIKNTEKRLKELKYTGGTESIEDVKKKVFDDYSKGKWSYGDKIDNTDPYAIEKISGKIKYMEDAHDVTLLYNKMCKKNGVSNWSWADRTDEDKAKRREVLEQTVNAAKEKGYSDSVIKEGI